MSVRPRDVSRGRPHHNRSCHVAQSAPSPVLTHSPRGQSGMANPDVLPLTSSLTTRDANAAFCMTPFFRDGIHQNPTKQFYIICSLLYSCEHPVCWTIPLQQGLHGEGSQRRGEPQPGLLSTQGCHAMSISGYGTLLDSVMSSELQQCSQPAIAAGYDPWSYLSDT